MVGVLCLALGTGLFWSAAQFSETIADASQARNAPVATPLIAVFAVFSASIVEELAFRVWFITHAAKAISAPMAMALSSLAFMAIHTPANTVEVVWYLMVGVILGVLWIRTRSLLACILAHSVINVWVVALTWLAGSPCPARRNTTVPPSAHLTAITGRVVPPHRQGSTCAALVVLAGVDGASVPPTRLTRNTVQTGTLEPARHTRRLECWNGWSDGSPRATAWRWRRGRPSGLDRAEGCPGTGGHRAVNARQPSAVPLSGQLPGP